MVPVSVAEDFELVDVWMLGQRYREAIIQTKTEMREFIRSLSLLRTDLENDIKLYYSMSY